MAAPMPTPHLPAAIFAELLPVNIGPARPALAQASGLTLTTNGLAMVGADRVAFAPLTPDQMLVWGTIMARAARQLGADPDAADAALLAMAQSAKEGAQHVC